MKGFITRALLMAGSSAVLAAAGGCYTYSDFVDPCWPERYEYMARQEVREPADAQAYNGHVLDQTVWNCMFEPGTDKLTPGGFDHLDYLVRRRPCPDPQVFLQTAHDLTYDPAAPEKFAMTRCDLDAKRIASVQKYLTAASAGRHIDFQVTVHDPGDPSISAIPGNIAVRRMWDSPQGTLVSGSVGGAGAVPVTGGAGAVPPGAR